MRLIDADKFEVISWRAQGGREYANGFDDGVDYVVKKIDDAPTINAIPVEWLEAQIFPYSDILKNKAKGVFNATIREMIYRWQKEQEVRT